MAKAIYKITISNWEKHNSSKKKGHSHILLSTGFLRDAKIASLSPTGVLLFLSCLCLAGESTSSQFEVSHESLRSQSRVKSESIESQLTQLQSFQLITFEKTLLIEEKRREKNRIEVLDTRLPAVSAPKKSEYILAKERAERNRPVRQAYVDAYKLRYQQEPIRDGHLNSIISQIVNRIGPEDAVRVVRFFVSHNSTFYAGKCHAIKFCLADLDTLLVQTNKGKQILKSDLKKFEEATDAPVCTPEEVREMMARLRGDRGALNEPG